MLKIQARLYWLAPHGPDSVTLSRLGELSKTCMIGDWKVAFEEKRPTANGPQRRKTYQQNQGFPYPGMSTLEMLCKERRVEKTPPSSEGKSSQRYPI
jgi:hypothetical protein